MVSEEKSMFCSEWGNNQPWSFETIGKKKNEVKVVCRLQMKGTKTIAKRQKVTINVEKKFPILYIETNYLFRIFFCSYPMNTTVFESFK